MPLTDKIPNALIDQFLSGTISDGDKEILSAWFDQFSDQEVQVLLSKRSSRLDAKQAIWNKIERRTGIGLADMPGESGKGAQYGRRRLRYSAVAAACLLLVGLGWYLLAGPDRVPQKGLTESIDLGQQVVSDHNGAILTLSDGTVVELDSTGAGQIASQGAATIVQRGSQVYYEASGKQSPAQTTLFNTMATPRGKQFSLVLPDGTKVWLNAASSIRYPVSFDREKRVVDITGEVYFEVAAQWAGDKRTRIPFEVHTDQVVIDVLGTHFDVKSYADEQTIKATLLEGRIQVYNKKQGIIRTMVPGQRATIDKGGTGAIALERVDAAQQIAWKEGLFYFKDEPLSEILRQIARWYDVKVDAAAEKKGLRFSGVVSKRARLADLLKVLSATGVVEFRIDEHEVYGY